MRAPKWTIDVAEKDLDVLTRNREAMVAFLRDETVTDELRDDFHKCIETLGEILESARPTNGR
jgi:hypothetical protein